MKTSLAILSLASLSSAASLDQRLAALAARRHSLRRQEAASLSSEQKEENRAALKKKLAHHGITAAALTLSVPKHFEIRKFLQDGSCGSDMNVGAVEGLRMNRCVDSVLDESNDVGKANSMSTILALPNDGGFPLMLFYDNHRCRFDEAYDIKQLTASDFGFQAAYSVGTCDIILGPNGPMYFGKADWHLHPFEPPYDAVFKAQDGTHKGCEADRMGYYDIIQSGACIENEEAGSSVWHKMTVSDCSNENFSVTRSVYSDPCNTLTDTETFTEPQHCMFDYQEFKDGFDSNGVGEFHYGSKWCSKATTFP